MFAAALHHTHGCVPVLHIRHHGEHHPQRAAGGRTQQCTDLRLELVGLAQTVADAPQAKLGGLQALISVGHGAVGTKVKGAHRYRAALGGSKAGAVEEILFLLVEDAARQHHIAAAQQAHAPRAGLHGCVDIFRAEAVGQQFKGLAVLCAVGQCVQTAQLFVLALQLADAGLGLLAGDGIRVQYALALGGIQNDGAAVAVVQKITAHLHKAGDVHCPGNDGSMALAAALGGDDA